MSQLLNFLVGSPEGARRMLRLQLAYQDGVVNFPVDPAQ
jgi:hypothetical protein